MADLAESRGAFGNDPSTSSKRTIASRACGNCRARKTRCDESRPRCGLCERLNLVCQFQEAQPTKKDKSLTLILESLARLERRFDRYLIGSSHQPSTQSRQSPTSISPYSGSSEPSRTNSSPPSQFPSNLSRDRTKNPQQHDAGGQQLTASRAQASLLGVPYHQRIAAHSILEWPVMRTVLAKHAGKLNLGNFLVGGASWIIKLCQVGDVDIPMDEMMLATLASDALQDSSLGLNVFFTELDENTFRGLVDAYFATFHCAYPILDPSGFHNLTLKRIRERGFADYEPGSVLTLLVLALGDVAVQGTQGGFIRGKSNEKTRGVKGGSIHKPPGLRYFIESQRRMGFIITQCNLETVQCLALMALYFSQSSRVLDYWRMASYASTLCQALVISNTEWNTPYADLLARAYWFCFLIEGGIVSELELPSTQISQLQNDVPFPTFPSASAPELSPYSDIFFSEYQFLAHISLSKLLNRVQGALYHQDHNTYHRGPSPFLITELLRQLEDWREHLPQVLCWDDEPWTPDSGVSRSPAFVDNTRSVDFKDLLLVSLRSRYQYARYLVLRPHLYNALHYPNLLTESDISACMECIQTCVRWPICSPGFRDKKRVLPMIYEWNQIFFGVLILLHVVSEDGAAGPLNISINSYKEDISSMINWIQDMKVLHPLASWSWHVLETLYADRDG